MTIAVDLGRTATKQAKQNLSPCLNIEFNFLFDVFLTTYSNDFVLGKALYYHYFFHSFSLLFSIFLFLIPTFLLRAIDSLTTDSLFLK